MLSHVQFLRLLMVVPGCRRRLGLRTATALVLVLVTVTVSLTPGALPTRAEPASAPSAWLRFKRSPVPAKAPGPPSTTKGQDELPPSDSAPFPVTGLQFNVGQQGVGTLQVYTLEDLRGDFNLVVTGGIRVGPSSKINVDVDGGDAEKPIREKTTMTKEPRSTTKKPRSTTKKPRSTTRSTTEGVKSTTEPIPQPDKDITIIVDPTGPEPPPPPEDLTTKRPDENGSNKAVILFRDPKRSKQRKGTNKPDGGKTPPKKKGLILLERGPTSDIRSGARQ